MPVIIFAEQEVPPSKLLRIIDSLEQSLQRSQRNTQSVRVMIELAENYRNTNLDSTLSYTQQALTLAEEIDYVHGQLGALGFMGDALISKGNLPLALEKGLEALEIGRDMTVRETGVGPSYENLGRIYFQLGENEKALEYFRIMTRLGKGDRIGVAFGHYSMAMVFESLNELDSAEVHLHMAADTFAVVTWSVYPEVYPVYPLWYNVQARVAEKRGAYVEARQNYARSLSLTLANHEPVLTAETYIDLANFFARQDDSDSSIYFGHKALTEAGSVFFQRGMYQAAQILAEQYEHSDIQQAYSYYKLADSTRQKLYGSGNIQLMRDIIAQDEERKRTLLQAEEAYNNRLKLYGLLGSLFFLLAISLIMRKSMIRTRKANSELERAMEDLKYTQSQLIHAEKMASLGELTAGIAHEIQNPLNFVNNFSEVNRELIEELRDALNKGDQAEAVSIMQDLRANETKVIQHGRRAEGIIKSMLQHSRTSEGTKELTDLNGLCEEYVRLAYHGMRARDKSFNAEFELDLDPDLPMANVVPQDIGRVILNLVNNAFQAVGHLKDGKVVLQTKSTDGSIKVSVKDNGPGISDEIKKKIFQPFFTTKPTGQGTGLGLSLSYDIVTKGHGGSLKLFGEKGEGATFIMTLPL